MKLLVFTGTGNSLYIAKKVQKDFDAEILSIPKLLNDEIFDIVDEKVGIIIPIYALELPSMVDEYLKKVNIKSNYIFAIFNHALFSFDTKTLINRYSFKVDYVKQIKMPNNYLPVFDMAKTKKDINFDEKINSIIDDIKKRLPYFKKDVIRFSLGNIIRKFNKANYKNEDNKFYITDECKKCGVCKKVCVSNNIDIQDKVMFFNKCEQCLACIHLCQSRAIHHKNEKNSERYINDKVQLREIIEINDY